MKKKITKEAYENLSEAIKELYIEKDGSYVLDLEDEEDNGALLRAKEREKEKAREAKNRAKELEAELLKYKEMESAKEEQEAKKTGDIATLEKKWEAKFNEAISAKEATINNLTQKLNSTIVDSLASKIANEISTAPDLMVEFVKKRLTVDLENDTPVARVLDADGKLSAKSIDELASDFKKDPKYSSIIIGSKASGGAKTEPVAPTTPSSSGSKGEVNLSPDAMLASLQAKFSKE